MRTIHQGTKLQTLLGNVASCSAAPVSALVPALGAYSGGGFDAAIDVGELVLYNRLLTTDETTAVRNYLNGRWNCF